MCKTCAQKQQAMGYALNQNRIAQTEQTDCVYTVDQIANKLSELIESGDTSINISYLRSALKMYNKDCNLFKTQLDEIL